MTSEQITFEQAVEQLMALADKEQEVISNGDSDLPDSDKSFALAMLVGYKKALQDILSVCSPQEEQDEQL